MAKEIKETKIDVIDKQSGILPINATNIQDRFLYEKSMPKLKSWQVEGGASSGGAKYFIGNSSCNSSGDHSITGVGFTPTSIKITACVNSGSISDGYYDGTTQISRYVVFPGGTAGVPGIVGVLAYLETSGGSNSTLTGVSLDSDGFTYNAISSNTVYFIYECFG